MNRRRGRDSRGRPPGRSQSATKRHKIDSNPAKSVFVASLQVKATESDVAEFFRRELGITPLEVSLIRERGGLRKSKGMGYVAFNTLEEASKARTADGRMFKFYSTGVVGFPIRVEAAKGKELPPKAVTAAAASAPTAAASAPTAAVDLRTKDYGSDPYKNVPVRDIERVCVFTLSNEDALKYDAPPGEYAQYPNGSKYRPSRYVLISNLHPQLRAKDVKTLLKPFGQVNDVKLVPSADEDGVLAHVDFASHSSSVWACSKLHGLDLLGRVLTASVESKEAFDAGASDDASRCVLIADMLQKDGESLEDAMFRLGGECEDKFGPVADVFPTADRGTYVLFESQADADKTKGVAAVFPTED